MAKYDLGGHEIKQDAGGETVKALDQNKTLFVSALTGEEALKPEFTQNLKTIKDVFEHYKPSKEVEFIDDKGAPINNELRFNSISDFGRKGLINNSEYLKNLEAQKSEYQKFIKMLKIKQMGNIINDVEAKASYIEILQSMIAELEATVA